ncbi:hypothetical protein [Cohnella thailandensis]|uniref:Uncharacterized protein n=1 Tax=Cohnella thailandensis TaxID=557557 RepID=A0A841SP91_9BACL|nr:hypothetical protein [Cohnella thailandensis]MBB6632609.1 hypothetical protein [Cohnella thailandensis]MBP1975704.1 hypothetical protein [Cohnella thailandensis]
MGKGWGPTLLVVVFAMMFAGCTEQSNEAEQTPHASATIEVEVSHTPEPEAQEPETEDFSVVVGDAVKLETTMEHETAIFDGTEYTIEPYGVTFAVRTSMGEPAIEGKKAVFTKDLSGEAMLSYKVIEDSTLDDAVAQEIQDHEDSFFGEFVETTSLGGLRGKHNQFNDDSVFSGVIFYEFDRHVLRIEYRSPINAVDAMVRIVNETMDSVRA